MSRPCTTDELYEHWFLAECCRCGRRRHRAGTWPDGYVCRTCSDRAVRTWGICPQKPGAHARAAAAGQGLDVGPMTYQGRVITAEVIEQMRAEQPEHAHQLDDAWARMVLENNRPWTEDAELRVGTEAVRAGIRKAAPAAFASCGTGGDDQPHLHAPDAPGVWRGPA